MSNKFAPLRDKSKEISIRVNFTVSTVVTTHTHITTTTAIIQATVIVAIASTFVTIATPKNDYLN